MLPLLQLSSNKARKRRVNLHPAGILAAAAAFAAAGLGAGLPSRAAAPASSATLALNASVLFVLDETISSRAKAGTVVRAHLKDPIVVDGVTAAPAGAPEEIEITQTSAAQMGNVDGSADVFFRPLRLADGKSLPLITPTSHLDPQSSAGAQSTRDVTDTVGDIFIPYHIVYHILRKGSDVTLRPGTVIRARAGAALQVVRGQLSVIAPAPIVTSNDAPSSVFVPAPLETPPGYRPPTPKPSPSTKPTQTP